jgi:exosortase
MAAFVLCYGVQSFRAGLYPLCCMFLLIPLPPSWMDRVAAGLQHGSAAVSYEILRLSGIPVLRRGMLFSLPGLDFEVAPECSGIRSSLALMMVAIVAGYVYLRSGWARSALILLTVPIVLFKNAVRIVVISTLGAFVDRVFIDGPFHHRYGGLLFTVVGVVLFVLVLAGLQKVERRRPGRTVGQS